jgi:hypothetical protein
VAGILGAGGEEKGPGDRLSEHIQDDGATSPSEGRGKERKERKGEERRGKERKGEERRGKERKGEERREKERREERGHFGD